MESKKKFNEWNESVIKYVPNDTTVLSDMGAANQNASNYYEAISSYSKAIRLDSTYYRNFKLRGECKYNLDDYDCVFLGAWNFMDYIMDKEKEFKGKFITHVTSKI